MSEIDYTSVLTALESEKAVTVHQFDMAIAAIRLLAERASRQPSQAQQITLGEVDDGRPAPPFSGMTVAKAAATYLRAMDKPRTTGDIAKALTRGGMVSHSQ